MTTRAGAVLVFAPLALLAAPVARADCAGPADYLVVESPPGRVAICPERFYGHGCPDQDLLRESLDDGAVVRITDCASEVGTYGETCFVDECVPAGRYRYGLATPPCQTCGSAYFQEVTVAGAGASCTRSGAPPGSADGVPWGDGSSRVCYGDSGKAFGCATASASVLGVNAALLLLGLLFRWRRGRSRA